MCYGLQHVIHLARTANKEAAQINKHKQLIKMDRICNTWQTHHSENYTYDNTIKYVFAALQLAALLNTLRATLGNKAKMENGQDINN